MRPFVHVKSRIHKTKQSLPAVRFHRSGSGCVSTFVASILGPSGAVYLCTDINPAAASATLRTGKQNGATLEPILTSLHYPLAERICRKVDLLIFNPPYVPTGEEEELAGQLDAGIVASWAGGLEGMTTTKLLMQAVPVCQASTLSR